MMESGIPDPVEWREGDSGMNLSEGLSCRELHTVLNIS